MSSISICQFRGPKINEKNEPRESSCSEPKKYLLRYSVYEYERTPLCVPRMILLTLMVDLKWDFRSSSVLCTSTYGLQYVLYSSIVLIEIITLTVKTRSVHSGSLIHHTVQVKCSQLRKIYLAWPPATWSWRRPKDCLPQHTTPDRLSTPQWVYSTSLWKAPPTNSLPLQLQHLIQHTPDSL